MSTPILETKEINVNETEWKDPPTISFNEKVSFRIARWILVVFTLICAATCLLIFFAFQREDATFDGIVQLIQFPLVTILPLVMLAVGFYLGDKK